MRKLAFGANDPRVHEFVKQVGPKVYADLGRNRLCIVGNGGGGLDYALGLYGYLKRQEIDGEPLDVEYTHLRNTGDSLYPDVIKGRLLLFVDDGINTGAAYRTIMSRLPEFQSQGAIDAVFAAPFDKVGFMAQYTCNDKFDTIDFLMRPIDLVAEYVAKAKRYFRKDYQVETGLANVPATNTGPRERIDTGRRRFVGTVGVLGSASLAEELGSKEYVRRLFGVDKDG